MIYLLKTYNSVTLLLSLHLRINLKFPTFNEENEIKVGVRYMNWKYTVFFLLLHFFPTLTYSQPDDPLPLPETGPTIRSAPLKDIHVEIPSGNIPEVRRSSLSTIHESWGHITKDRSRAIRVEVFKNSKLGYALQNGACRLSCIDKDQRLVVSFLAPGTSPQQRSEAAPSPSLTEQEKLIQRWRNAVGATKDERRLHSLEVDLSALSGKPYEEKLGHGLKATYSAKDSRESYKRMVGGILSEHYLKRFPIEEDSLYINYLWFMSQDVSYGGMRHEETPKADLSRELLMLTKWSNPLSSPPPRRRFFLCCSIDVPLEVSSDHRNFISYVSLNKEDVKTLRCILERLELLEPDMKRKVSSLFAAGGKECRDASLLCLERARDMVFLGNDAPSADVTDLGAYIYSLLPKAIREKLETLSDQTIEAPSAAGAGIHSGVTPGVAEDVRFYSLLLGPWFHPYFASKGKGLENPGIARQLCKPFQWGLKKMIDMLTPEYLITFFTENMGYLPMLHYYEGRASNHGKSAEEIVPQFFDLETSKIKESAIREVLLEVGLLSRSPYDLKPR